MTLPGRPALPPVLRTYPYNGGRRDLAADFDSSLRPAKVRSVMQADGFGER